MAEHWKSTPKYWCKFCKTYIRDTKLERTNHEATPRHQNSISRSLRDLHRTHEREEREKQRAKNEVARLNGVVSGTSSVDSGGKRPAAPPAPAPVSEAERKRQVAQLAEMGIAVPEEFRRDMALAGDWQTVTPVVRKEEKAKKGEDVKPEVRAFGVRKRKHDGQEEEEEAGERVVRKGWGSTFKTYPGMKDESDDIEALLGGGAATAPVKAEEDEVKTEPELKKSESTEEDLDLSKIPSYPPEQGIKTEEEPKKEETTPAAAGIVFKKRKKAFVPPT